MKKVFTDPSVIPCDELKCLLESDGIFPRFKNEWIAGATGYNIPILHCPTPVWAWPEVWVEDRDFERATEITADFQREATIGFSLTPRPGLRIASTIFAVLLLAAALLGFL